MSKEFLCYSCVHYRTIVAHTSPLLKKQRELGSTKSAHVKTHSYCVRGKRHEFTSQMFHDICPDYKKRENQGTLEGL